MANVITYGVTLDASGAINGFKKLDAAIGESGRAATALEARAKTLGVALGVSIAGAGALAAAALRKVVRETSEAEAAQAQLTAALRSTGGAAGQTLGSLNAHASALQRTTTYSDDAVTSAQSVLLIFNKISGDAFPKATEAALNLAARMGGDLNGAALQVGKALQGTDTGVNMLRRSYGLFSDAQLETIKHLTATNRLAEAQAIILGELGTKFGGAATAARDTLGGALEGLTNQWGELFEASSRAGRAMAGAVNMVADALPRIKEGLSAAFANSAFGNLLLKIFDRPSTATIALPTFGAGTAAPITITAAVSAEEQRHQAFLQSRADAKEREAWELKEIERLNVIAALAGLKPLSVPGAVTGRTGLSFDFGRIKAGAGVTRLPAGVGTRTLSEDQGRALNEAKLAYAASMKEANAQIARNFTENVQGSIGSFFSEFLTTGHASVASLFQGFGRLAAEVLGQIAAKSIIESTGIPTAIGKVLGTVLKGPIGIALGVVGVGAALFGRRRSSGRGTPNPTYEEILAAPAVPRGTDPSQIGGRFGTSARANEIRQSVGGTLTESSAARIVGNLESIRVGIFQLVALASSGALGGNQVTVNASGSTSSGLASDAASAINRLLGGQVQQLRLAAGVAVLP